MEPHDHEAHRFTGPDAPGFPRLRLASVLLISALLIPLTALSLYDSMSRLNRPFHGFLTLPNGIVLYSGLPSWTGRQAELSANDRIVRVGEQPLTGTTRAQFQEAVETAHAVGRPVQYAVEREGRPLRLIIPTMEFSGHDWFLSIGALPWIATIYLLLGLGVYHRRRHLPAAFPFFIVVAGIGAGFLALYDFALGHRFPALSMIFHATFPLAVTTGYLYVPFTLPLRPGLRRAWLIGHALLSLVLTLAMWLTFRRAVSAYQVTAGITTAYGGLALLCLGATGLYKWRFSPNSLDRQRAKALNVGGWLAFGPSLIPALIMRLTDANIPLGPLLLFTVAYPVSIGYSIVRYNLFTMDRLVAQGISYAIASIPVVILYGANLVLLFWLTDEVGIGYAFGFAWLVFFATLILANPIQRRISRWIARRLGADPTYQKAIEEVSARLTHMLDVKEILSQVLRTVVRSMNLTHGIIMLPAPSGDDFKTALAEGDPPPGVENLTLMKDTELILLLRSFRREITSFEIRESPNLRGFCPSCVPALQALQATVIVPIIFQEDLKGILILGGKKDGGHFSQEDMEALRTIANQAAISLQNAISYQTIKVLNLSLEEKVHQRTRELEEALDQKERTQDELVRSQSLAAIGELVAGVAHEINNPLSSAYSLVQSIVEELGDGGRPTEPATTESMADDLRFVLKEQKRARDIIRSLLDLSRQSESYTEKIQLNDVIEDALRVLYNTYKNSPVTIVRTYAPNLPAIQGNFSQLGQVAINIIQNALQSLPSEGGRIEVGTSVHSADGHPPGDRLAGPSAVFFCTDNGCGIPKDTLLSIFKPFFTTKPVGQGTGLGLYICHQIVSRHAGAIRVESEPGKGTTFRVEIPVSPSPA
ncbi:MAG: GAF domain-containing protein [Nitrospirae bacterium]|nr:GAF domain-containing protein [Nitrospirota bacterium]